jgi:hypothetical protein
MPLAEAYTVWVGVVKGHKEGTGAHNDWIEDEFNNCKRCFKGFELH